MLLCVHMKITSLKAIEILDSRGKPTLRTFVTLDDGSIHASSVPSGASTGKHEALELRDSDEKRHLGQGVLKAIKHVNETIAKEIIGKEVDPKTIDKKMLAMDGTENKSNLGANAILSVSQAVVKAAAYAEKKQLWQFIHDYYTPALKPAFPRLMVNVINGGKHANWNFDIQEFIIITNDTQPTKSTRVAAEIFQTLGKILKKKGFSTLVGDEGGYSPPLQSNEEAYEIIIEAAKSAGYENGKDYCLAMDAAASEFYENGNYLMRKDNKEIPAQELLNYYLGLQKKYNVYSFEDVFEQDDWENFIEFTSHSNNGKDFIVVGDDLTVTNPKRIQHAAAHNAANAAIIKVNQIGSIIETIEAITLAKNNRWKVAVSHRSGETEDTFIADLAYGVGADFIKTGSMARSERLAKYNRLIEIEAGF